MKLIAKVFMILIVLWLCILVVFSASSGNNLSVSFLLTLGGLVVVVGGLLVFERGNVSANTVAISSVMTAIAVAGRVAFAAIPNVKPVSAVIIITGAVFGKRCGFVTGILTAFISNMIFGQGPWTVWQMLAWGLMGICSGVFSDAGIIRNRYFAAIFGFIWGYIFGFIMNIYHIVSFLEFSVAGIVTASVGSFAFDTAHAVGNFVFLLTIWNLSKTKLTRINDKINNST